MSDNQAGKWDIAIRALAEKTRRNEIKWQTAAGIRNKRENVIGQAYITTYQQKVIAVYEYEYRYYTDADEYHMVSDVAIELVDNNGELLWRLPEIPSRGDLLDAVRFQTVGAEDLLESLLSDAEEES